ncbi:MAG: DUF4221 family protein [Chitinophagaceae bacterium]|nr:DUF4221 family protein [Chitinophagaceae bacterium]
MRVSLLIIVICVLYSCREKKLAFLENPNFLVLSDSIIVNLDSVTLANSTMMQLNDSDLMIYNDILTSVTILNLKSHSQMYFDYSRYKSKNEKFIIDGAWFKSMDSIFLYSSYLKKIYLVNREHVFIDSFPTKTDSNKMQNSFLPMPFMSTSQLPFMHGNSIYATGFALGEDSKYDDSKRMVVTEISKMGINYFVNYPEDYESRDWGGIYYRMVYNCYVNDTLMYISFPASDYIAKFNIKTKTTEYFQLFPSVNKLIRPYNGNATMSSSDNFHRAKHFYGQYSFKGILFDSYRNIFYRFLMLPATHESIKKGKLGSQKKYLLAYDEKFNYLGFTELGESVSSLTALVTKNGLLIKDEKYYYDEDNLHFNLYTIDNRDK